MSGIKQRKADHIRICLEERIAPGYCYWNDVKFIHNALPEINADDIDMRTEIFGKTLECPLMVTAITGGFPDAVRINGNIAEACAELGMGMGVGSQRAGIDGVCEDSYSVIKDYDVPLVVGNVGAPQLVEQHGKRAYGVEDIRKAKDLIDADVMAIHLNFLQEVVQPEGDTNAKGCLNAISDISRELPIIVKETGAGISKDVANRLKKQTAIKGFDIAGMGGTSFSAVELYRAISAEDCIRSSMGETFFDWGIPAPVSVKDANVGLPIIASGGILNGVHVAASIAMGASCAGVAHSILKEATESAEAVKTKLNIIKEELRAAMLMTGSADIKQLSNARHIISGETKTWLEGM